MKAQLPDKRGMFTKLGGSTRKLSLRERRRPNCDKLSLSVSKESKKQDHPVHRLKQGEYDIDTEHLLVVSEDGSDDAFEQSINMFLEQEKVRPVQAGQFMKDM